MVFVRKVLLRGFIIKFAPERFDTNYFRLIYTTNFKEVQTYQGISIRNRARNLALDLLSFRNTFLDTEALLARPRVHFLFIHHIFKDEVATFEKVLDKLSEKHTFISHTEAVKRVVSGDIDKPYISWSSDDGFENNLKAAEILDRYNAKCCFFINPESIGKNNAAWITDFCGTKLKMPPVAFMNWEEVASLQKRGHEIGSHTLEHTNVSQMSLDAFEQDLILSKSILEERCGSIAHFAYPYGRFFDFNKGAFDLVFKTGYDSCSTAERGCHISDGTPIEKTDLLIRRDQVICAWKLEHIMYFISNSAKRAVLEMNYAPDSFL